MKTPRLVVLRLWWLAFAVAPLPAQVVINEIYYEPPDRTKPTEFVELHNAGAGPIDLSGWRFDSGIDYVFPGGATLPAGGYVVVAQDPAAFQTAFGFAPLGPFTGKLSNDGERLRLRDSGSATVDDVTYGAGFPWPTGARGAGSSMELLNPALDNALPGSWRSSGQPDTAPGAQVYVPVSDPVWHYRKGTGEASAPVTAWRFPGFVEDASWLIGQTSIGFGDDDDNTELTDMQGGYSSIYLRRIFNLPVGQIPTSLRLKVRVDDGCVVWINGTEVARLHVGAGTLAYNGTGTNHEADPSVFEEVVIPNAASFLVAGDNVIAVHALNQSISSSDFTIDVGLESSVAVTSSALPTPGTRNSVFSLANPPSIQSVAHAPEQPASGQAVTVTARITDPQGVASASLSYQIVAPGSYLRKTDAAYATSWTNVPMRDDGTNGDAVSGDAIFTAVLPGSMQVNRRLIRYRIIAADAGGAALQVPYADDESPNFAYFVYDGIPSWTGAFNPGVTAPVTYPSTLLRSLPAYHLIANAADVTNSQYVSSFNGRRMLGTMVSNGKVYDHIEFNNRGEVSTYVSGKNKWRFHFNRARSFPAVDNWGRPYPELWDELNLNACASPWVAANRGMAGLEEALSFRLYALAGVNVPQTHFLHFRVIDDAAESPAGSQFDGDQWGLYLAVEQPDGSFLDERGLPDGNLYKIESSRGDKKHQGETQPIDTSDWDTFLAGSRLGGQTEAWWRENLDLGIYFSYRSCDRITGNVDLREGANHYFFHPPDGHWQPIGWDFDFMFVPKRHQSGTIDQKNCLLLPAIALEYRNRARELLDLLCSDAGASGGQFGQLVDEYAQLVNPAGQALTWADFDASMWNYHPRTTAAHLGKFFVTPITDSFKGGTRTRTLVSSDHEGFVKYLTDYSTNTFPIGSTWVVNNGDQRGYGYKFLESEAADPDIPARPTITYTGPGGAPINDLRFTTSAFGDPQGAGTFAAMQWRVGEISAPGIPLYDLTKPRIYEVTDVWRSAELPFAAETRLSGSTLQVGHTYRARVRHKDTTGRWSRWSDAITFVAGAASAGPYQQGLAITEMMYNPSALTPAETTAGFTDKQDFEFIELQNIGPDPLDLNSLGFTAGISFAFPAAILAPGAHILVAKNVTAFNLRYGSGKPVAGTYTGNLDNSGESLTLSYAGNVVESFAYSDGSHPVSGQPDLWPTEPDGTGYSLVLIDPPSHPNPALAASWRASRKPGGSPGAADTIRYDDWATQYPGIGGSGGNPDADPRPNHLEYAFGSDPTQPDHAPLAAGSVQSLSVNAVLAPYLTVSFTRQVGATDVNYAVEFSPDLVTWTPGGVRHSAILNGNGTITETWRSANPVTATQRLFVRVRKSTP